MVTMSNELPHTKSVNIHQKKIRFSFFITVGKYLLTFCVVALRGEMRKDVILLVTPSILYSPKTICIFRPIIYALCIL